MAENDPKTEEAAASDRDEEVEGTNPVVALESARPAKTDRQLPLPSDLKDKSGPAHSRIKSTPVIPSGEKSQSVRIRFHNRSRSNLNSILVQQSKGPTWESYTLNNTGQVDIKPQWTTEGRKNLRKTDIAQSVDDSNQSSSPKSSSFPENTRLSNVIVRQQSSLSKPSSLPQPSNVPQTPSLPQPPSLPDVVVPQYQKPALAFSAIFTIATRPQSLPPSQRLDSPLSIVPQQQEPPLDLSAILALANSPQNSSPDNQPASPLSIGPQRTESTEVSPPPSPQPPSPPHNAVPKYTSAFDYAMHPFLDLDNNIDLEPCLHLPAQDTISAPPSPNFPPLRDDEISYASTDSDADLTKNYVPEDGIPERLFVLDPFRTILYLTRFRTLVMRCAVLQTSVLEIERQPWANHSNDSDDERDNRKEEKKRPYYYYSKILNLATKAIYLAQALQSSDLEARGSYWAGRGSGGTRDFVSAVHYFEASVNLDVENDVHPSGRIRLRGLRPAEKADVAFLLDRARTCCLGYEGGVEDVRSKAMGELLDHEELWTDFEAPPWFPDRDRVIQIAAREFGLLAKLGRKAKYLGELEREDIGRELEDRVQKQWKREGIADDVGEITRRVLSRGEWRYVKRGDGRVMGLVREGMDSVDEGIISPREVMRAFGGKESEREEDEERSWSGHDVEDELRSEDVESEYNYDGVPRGSLKAELAFAQNDASDESETY